MSSEFPDVWRWLQSLTPLQRVQALSLTNEVVATVIINLVYYERKEGKRVSKREEERRRRRRRNKQTESCIIYSSRSHFNESSKILNNPFEHDFWHKMKIFFFYSNIVYIFLSFFLFCLSFFFSFFLSLYCSMESIKNLGFRIISNIYQRSEK